MMRPTARYGYGRQIGNKMLHFENSGVGVATCSGIVGRIVSESMGSLTKSSTSSFPSPVIDSLVNASVYYYFRVTDNGP